MSLKLVVMLAAAVLALTQGTPQKIIIPEKNTANNSPSHTGIQPLHPQIEKMSARAPVVSARRTHGASSNKDTRELLSVEPQQPQVGAKTGNELVDVLDELDTTEEELLNMLGPDFHGDLNRMTFEEIMDALDDAELKEEEEEEELTEKLSPEDMKEFEAWEKGEEDEEEELTEKLTPEDMKEFEAWEEGEKDEEIKEQMSVVDVPLTPYKLQPLPVVDSKEKAIDVTWKELEDLEQLEEEVNGRSYRRWPFFTIILILAVVVIIGYCYVKYNRKKNRKGKNQREAVARVKTFENY